MSVHQALSQRPRRPHPWCCFRSGERSLAVDLKTVVEVIETERLVRLPHGPRVVLGLCAFRRDVIPVVRLANRVPDSGCQTGRTDVLILRTEQGFWGLLIDRSGTAVVEEALEESSEPPWGDAEALAFLGELRRGESVVSVLDPEATWLRLRAAVERDFHAPPDADDGSPLAVALTGGRG